MDICFTIMIIIVIICPRSVAICDYQVSLISQLLLRRVISNIIGGSKFQCHLAHHGGGRQRNYLFLILRDS